jgi:hypothetical protein
MSKLYYAQPLFWEGSPDFEHLATLPAKFTLDTPGAGLALALNYYCFEAYARRADRDAACGATARPDVKYVPAAAVPADEITELGCGHAIDHPDFQKVLGPIFNRKADRLISKMIAAGRSAEGPIAMEVLSIARTRYTIEAIADRDFVRFEVDGLAVFEKGDRTMINATCAFLEQRLHLHLSPTLPKRKAH